MEFLLGLFIGGCSGYLLGAMIRGTALYELPEVVDSAEASPIKEEDTNYV